jgi:hypothetical protein
VREREGTRGLLDRANVTTGIDRHIDQLLLLSQLRCTYVYRTKPSTNSETPVPSARYRKGKRRKDDHSKTRLRYNGEPQDLPARRGGT